MRRVRLKFPSDTDAAAACEVSVWSIDAGSPPPSSTLPNDAEVLAADCPSIGDPSLVGRVLTRRLLAEMLHIKSHQVALIKDERGRPALNAKRMAFCPAAARLDFSCAHSDNLFAAGVALDGRIGVDIEVLRPENVRSPIACRELAPAEQAWILALPESERPLAFYHCWTAKEALVKALGLGVSFGMEQIEIVRDAGGVCRLAKISNSRKLAEGWSLKHRVVEFDEVPALVAVVWAR